MGCVYVVAIFLQDCSCPQKELIELRELERGSCNVFYLYKQYILLLFLLIRVNTLLIINLALMLFAELANDNLYDVSVFLILNAFALCNQSLQNLYLSNSVFSCRFSC